MRGQRPNLRISIHALLAESDSQLKPPIKPHRYFYPRSPCGERPRGEHHASNQQEFLSTLSLRRATHLFASSGVDFAISIHALLAESDQVCICVVYYTCKFLSTLSLRRATGGAILSFYAQKHFYPRSPCGERRQVVSSKLRVFHFYPRSPCGERHKMITIPYADAIISIHALLAESDSKSAQNSGALLRI